MSNVIVYQEQKMITITTEIVAVQKSIAAIEVSSVAQGVRIIKAMHEVVDITRIEHLVQRAIDQITLTADLGIERLYQVCTDPPKHYQRALYSCFGAPTRVYPYRPHEIVALVQQIEHQTVAQMKALTDQFVEALKEVQK